MSSCPARSEADISSTKVCAHVSAAADGSAVVVTLVEAAGVLVAGLGLSVVASGFELEVTVPDETVGVPDEAVDVSEEGTVGTEQAATTALRATLAATARRATRMWDHRTPELGGPMSGRESVWGTSGRYPAAAHFHAPCPSTAPGATVPG
jgi:hypothetical protein